MGLQVSCGDSAEVSQEGAVRKTAAETEGYSEGIVSAARSGTGGRRLRPDHVHLCLSIPPKMSVAFVIGFLKGKSAVQIHRMLGEKKLTGLHFCSRGYCVSTAGLEESRVREYIRQQEREETGQGSSISSKAPFGPRRGLSHVTAPLGGPPKATRYAGGFCTSQFGTGSKPGVPAPAQR